MALQNAQLALFEHIDFDVVSPQTRDRERARRYPLLLTFTERARDNFGPHWGNLQGMEKLALYHGDSRASIQNKRIRPGSVQRNIHQGNTRNFMHWSNGLCEGAQEKTH